MAEWLKRLHVPLLRDGATVSITWATRLRRLADYLNAKADRIEEETVRRRQARLDFGEVR